ncbi:unnamed protein product [Ambrosiozyma monospora]|uniref:Unnamed protein product n=1 Tax=Ambrosiozyma monospora TaxID=43982 RepID=A0ACB5TYH6_AMBMO|nr:unnamed protein product [Ambrosiozyma monospora]
MIKLKESTQFVNALYVKGSIGDDAHDRFKIENKLQQLELEECAVEAESIKKGWAKFFFPVCQEVTMNEALRRRINSIEDRKEVLSQEWINEVEKIEKKVEKQQKKKSAKK